MQNQEVFKRYAEYYDLMYRDKDYEGECDFVERILREYSAKTGRTILDVGSGTGSHSIPLARRGYALFGVDGSETMLKRAREKASAAGLAVDFRLVDIRDFNLDRKFDACICMFNVIGYLTEDKDVRSALSKIRAHLKEDALFISDFWNGLAVLHLMPSVRVKTIEDGEMRLFRTAEPTLDAFNQVCKLKNRVLISQNRTIIDEVEETHVSRFFFPREIARFWEEAGFDIVKICPFLDLEGKVDENVWNITVVARAKGG